MRRHEIGDHVLPVEPHLTNPRQMIEPDLIDLHAGGLDAEHPREGALKADRDVAETDRLVPVIE